MSHHHPHHKTSREPQLSGTDAGQSASKAEACENQPPVERVRQRAYEISQARKGGPGDAVADWTQAEQELRAGRDVKR